MPDDIKVLKTVYSVGDFLEWQRSGTLDLRPYFQRNSTWSPQVKSYLIDTLMRGYPVPVLLLQTINHPDTGKAIRRVVDGQQRLRTILSFIDTSVLTEVEANDIFKIMRLHNKELAAAGGTWKSFDQDLRDRLLDTQLSVHVLDRSVDDPQVLELFARMNSTAKSLNDQEQRNAKYHGDFKTCAYDLAYQNFSRWRGWGVFTTAQIAEMREVEFVGELLAYVLQGVASKSKASLDGLYAKYEKQWAGAQEAQQRFNACFDLIDEALEAESSKPPLQRFQQQGWMYALFALVHDATYNTYVRVEDDIEPDATPGDSFDKRQLIRAMKGSYKLFISGDVPETLTKALRGASTDRGSRQIRLDFLRSHLR